MKLLITGANGFLGSEIVRQAIRSGFSVKASDCQASSKFPAIDFIQADILDRFSLSHVLDDVDVVCHVAGLAHIFNRSKMLSAPFYSINVVGAENVLQSASRAGVRNFVLISSVSVYGGVARGKAEESECHPESPYADSKWQAERRLAALCQKEGINLTILRLATLYGEEDPGNVVRLIRAIDRRRFVWVGKGKNRKSLLHREDAARACIAAIKVPISGINIYNVSAPPCTMADVVSAIALALENSVPACQIPESFAVNAIKVIKKISFNHRMLSAIQGTLQKWLSDDYYSTDRFYDAFGFQTKIGLEEGIRREVAWYRNTCSAQTQLPLRLINL